MQIVSLKFVEFIFYEDNHCTKRDSSFTLIDWLILMAYKHVQGYPMSTR